MNKAQSTAQFKSLAPFGTTDDKNYQTSYQKFEEGANVANPGKVITTKYAAGVTSWPGTHYIDMRMLNLEVKYQHVMVYIKEMVLSGGIDGLLTLRDTFSRLDKAGSGGVDFQSFLEGTGSITQSCL